jgi:hypothetical protein
VKVWALWHGGTNYSLGYVDDDIEVFDSLQAAKDTLYNREECSDPYYPCVEESSMYVYFSDPRGLADPYPDRILIIGSRGGIRSLHC